MIRTQIVRAVICVASIAACVGLAAAAETTSSRVELRWALGALDADAGELHAVHKDSELEAGTKLKFLVEPLSAGSVYLVLLDSEDDLHLLYSGSATDAAERRYIPAGRQWLELDDRSGRETFFLLASAEPLEQLDRLLADHAATSEPMARKETSGAVVAEIRRLHSAHRKFAAAVEKPVSIGGRTRGEPTSEAEIDRIAVEVSADGFFGKTITIDH